MFVSPLLLAFLGFLCTSFGSDDAPFDFTAFLMELAEREVEMKKEKCVDLELPPPGDDTYVDFNDFFHMPPSEFGLICYVCEDCDKRIVGRTSAALCRECFVSYSP